MNNNNNNNNGTTVAQSISAEKTRQLAMATNAHRIGIVAERLSSLLSLPRFEPQKLFHLCLSLARGIDYCVANNEPLNQTSKLTQVLKEACSLKIELYVQSAIMVLMISVKNACKLGWFSAEETVELLRLADEVGNFFCTRRDINSETSDLVSTLSSVMSRYYPQYKLGQIITSIEVKPGYGTYLADFHITKGLSISKDERIRLLIAMTDNVETSSCIISPQQVNILLNGRPVDKRTNVRMDQGAQAPTVINHLLKYGTNLLQAVGQFNGSYIIVIALMSTLQVSDLPAPQDYVQPDTILSEADSEIIEGASRINLNCPISYRRIKIPAKGQICKHYQCFDLSNYIEINLNRPSWRCPLCNQSVNFTDLRVDRRMVKVLQEAGENVLEVIINADGLWKAASKNGKDDSGDKTTNKQDENQADESSAKSDGKCNVFDLTDEDYEMDTIDRPEFVDKKPTVHNHLQVQPMVSNSPSPSIPPRSANEVHQCSHPFSQGANGLSSALRPLTDGGISRNSSGVAPMLTDSVSPSFNRLPNHFQGNNNHPTSSSIGPPQPSTDDSLQLQELLYGRQIPRNVTRVPSAIQALPVQMPTPSSQQHVGPIMNLPPTSASPVPFQTPPASNQQAEWQRQLLQSQINALNSVNMPTAPPHNLAASQGVAMSSPSFNPLMSQTPNQSPNLMRSAQTLSQPPHLMRSPQTLSQPPHLMRSTQRPRGHHPQQGISPGVGGGPTNSQSTVQRVLLPPQQAPSQVRPPQTLLSQQAPSQVRPPQTHLPRSSSLPQAVSRTENLIDIQQAEQNWRPTGRMRGALQGQAYSAALSQYMSPGPGMSPASPTPDNYQVLMANRMIARATQMHDRSTTDGGTNIENGGTQGDASRG